MYRNLRLCLFLLLIMVFVIPVSLQAFPTNSLVLANSMTFATFTVNIVGVAGPGSYSPDTITINSGDTIVWNNTDIIPHSATCGTGTPCGMWDTGFISGASSPIPYSSFAVGTTHYYCTIHGDGALGMYGAVIRTAADVSDWKEMGLSDKSEYESPKITHGPFGIVFVQPGQSTENKTSNTSSKKDVVELSSKDTPSNIKMGGSIELQAQVKK